MIAKIRFGPECGESPSMGVGRKPTQGWGTGRQMKVKRLEEAGGPSPSRGVSRDRGVAEPAGWRSGSREEGGICSWGFGAGDCYREGGTKTSPVKY